MVLFRIDGSRTPSGVQGLVEIPYLHTFFSHARGVRAQFQRMTHAFCPQTWQPANDMSYPSVYPVRGFISIEDWHYSVCSRRECYELVYEKRVSAILHEAQQYTTLTALSRVTGIRHAQLSHYANAVSQPRPEQKARIFEGLHRIGESCLALLS